MHSAHAIQCVHSPQHTHTHELPIGILKWLRAVAMCMNKSNIIFTAFAGRWTCCWLLELLTKVEFDKSIKTREWSVLYVGMCGDVSRVCIAALAATGMLSTQFNWQSWRTDKSIAMPFFCIWIKQILTQVANCRFCLLMQNAIIDKKQNKFPCVACSRMWMNRMRDSNWMCAEVMGFNGYHTCKFEVSRLLWP